MSLVKIRFEVANEVQFSRAFETAYSKFLDMSQPFGKMAEEFFQTMGGVFAAEGAFESREKWVDLSPAYAKWKARHHPGRKILERTGRLKNSLTTPGGEDNVLVSTPYELSVGTRVPYAGFHQFGGGRLPQRKIIELTQAQKLRWVHIMHGYIEDIRNTLVNTVGGGI